MNSASGKNLRWLELTANVDAAAIEKLIPLFNEYGYGGAIVEEWPHDSGETNYVVRTYMPVNRSLKTVKSHLRQSIESIGLSIHVEERTLEPGEWLDEWKKYFEPFLMGEKTVIKPGWRTAPFDARGKNVIELDPGMAFGTGLHATTRLTYTRLEQHLKPGMTVLDLGTGSGILAIAAAKLGAASVLAIDNDPVAASAAAANAAKNGVLGTVEVKKSTLNITACRKYKNKFDLVVANITSDVIVMLSPCFIKVVKPGGRLITSGINDPGLDKVLVALSIAGFTLESIASEGEWHAVVTVRPEGD